MRDMKDSGIEWIGSIPESWSIIPIDGLFENRREKVSDQDYEPLSVTMQGILPQLENAAKTDNGDNRKLVKAGDFVINSRSDRRGSCGISSFEGSVSLINTVLKPRNNIIPEYYDWLFHTTEFAEEFYKWGHGIVDDLWSTNWQEMKKITVLYPDHSEQQKIADFLNKKCSDLDRLVADIEKQIKTLEAYKRSLITETVTKGLNPNVDFLDSEFKWIGEIPEHWKLTKIKASCTLKGRIGWQGLTEAEYVEEGPHLITGTDFCRNAVDWDRCHRVSEWRYDQDKNIQIRENDLLITKDGTVGKVALAKNAPEKATLNSGVMLIRPDKEACHNEYLLYILSSDIFWNWFFWINSGNTTIQHLYQHSFNEFAFPLPSLEEQKEIVRYLDSVCSELDSASDEMMKEIEILEEYKKSLIFEYVTGKKEIPDE